ncbi:DUF177 domain-containing protein [Thermodesulfobacteriota bacterium]
MSTISLYYLKISLLLMIVDLKNISKEPKYFRIVFDDELMKGHLKDDRILRIECPVEVIVSVSRYNDKFLAKGSLTGQLEMVCDRCLGTHSYSLKSEFSSYLINSVPDADNNEIELFEEDMELDFITGNEVNLKEIARGYVILALPMRSLCDSKCLGLCPECGKNLNIEKCDCYNEIGHEAFSKLKNLKIEGV